MTTKPNHMQNGALAFEIAQVFDELERLNRFVICCRKYPRRIIEKAYQDANAVPAKRIKKSRAATFFYLVKQYAHTSSYNSRDRPWH